MIKKFIGKILYKFQDLKGKLCPKCKGELILTPIGSKPIDYYCCFCNKVYKLDGVTMIK